MKTLVERRTYPRLDEERIGTMSGRVRPGHVVRLMNVSAGGALVETARRLAPGGIADLQLESGELRHATRVRVVRSAVSRVFPDALLFQSAVAFEQVVPWLSEIAHRGDVPALCVPALEQR